MLQKSNRGLLFPFLNCFKTAFKQSKLLRCCVGLSLCAILLMPSLRQALPLYFSLVFASGPASHSRTLRLHRCLLFCQKCSTSVVNIFTTTLLAHSAVHLPLGHQCPPPVPSPFNPHPTSVVDISTTTLLFWNDDTLSLSYQHLTLTPPSLRTFQHGRRHPRGHPSTWDVTASAFDITLSGCRLSTSSPLGHSAWA